MKVLLAICLFMLPFFLIRIVQKGNWREFCFGLGSDLFLVTQSVFALHIGAALVPTLYPYSFGFFLWALPLLSLTDAWMVANMGIRFRLVLLRQVRSAGNYWESAAAMGLSKWLLVAIAWCLCAIILTWIFLSKLWPSSQDIAISGVIAACSGLLLFCLDRRMPPLAVHNRHNLVVLEEKEWLSRLLKKNKEAPFSNGEVKIWLPDQQRSIFVDDRYPLLRVTQEFQGQTRFSLPRKEREKPHVIFISLESFRSCGIPLLDPFRPIKGLAPCFEKLAQEGIVWRNFYSVSTRSSKALLATLYGIPPQVGDEIFSHHPTFSLRGAPDILKEQGYLNAYLHNGDIDFDRQEEFLLSHRFDVVHGKRELRSAFTGEIQGNCWGVHDEYLMRHAHKFLSEREKEGRASFLYLFTISNHHPWRLPSGVSKRHFHTEEGVSDAPFLQTMHYSDHWLGWFIEQLRMEGLLEKSLVFIFGDHGQPLNEHGAQQREGIYEEAVRVPLLLLGKGIQAQTIDEVASQIDLLPTLLDLLGVTGLHHSVGRSLRRKSQDAEALFFSPFFPRLLGCRKDRWKLIHNPVSGEDELFDLIQDPAESVNLVQKEQKIACELRTRVLNNRDFFEKFYTKCSFVPFQHEVDVEIDLSGRTSLQDEELQELLGKTSPTSLMLDGCFHITDRGLIQIAKWCSRLRKLSLKDCSRITEKGLLSLVPYSMPLKVLNLSNCLTMDFQALEPFWQSIPSLQRLILRHQPFLTDSDLDLCLRHIGHLERLEAAESTNLTDNSLDALAKRSTALFYFALHCSSMTNRGVQTLLASSPQLRGFLIEGGHDLTDDALRECKNLENLSTVAVFDCPLLSDQGVLALSGVVASEIQIINCPGITNFAIDKLRKTTENVVWSG